MSLNSGEFSCKELIAMAYLNDVCGALTRTLEKFVTLNPHQLAGHVANLDFWLDETVHALALIDGYRERFERLQAAQTTHIQQHRTTQFDVERFDPIGESIPPPTKGVSNEELRQIRRALLDSAYRWLIRCHRAGLLDRNAVACALDRVGMQADKRDL